ncbi:MAG: energy-coupling factor ABC transporter permease [Lachnospiraceae bacterium]|nr:energy-coupling factor ABC transporter permease [Lachnospiraceae bacterium]MBQ4305186.1 energy-coupling factor ABC transporter permease [Lachnospiraceae bacterium]MBQ5360528.1 energy-coupling factor ABC transporter permease [Lachnospiraceae bacterium]
MHMADALVIPAVAGTMYLASSAAAGVSVHKVKLENDPKKIPAMGVMGAFVFAAQMINFTIPGTGSSGHLCGGLLLTAILGPWAGFLSMIGVLLTQCLFFADGGLLALGCNIWNMAFYGCFVGGLLIWKPIMKDGASKKKILLACVLGSVLTLQMGAFSVVMETMISGITELPFGTFVMAMQPIHLAIGLVEGLITAAVLCFIYDARPELLWGIGQAEKSEGRLTAGRTLGLLAILTALVAGILSLFASALPDGLEWAMERTAGTSELVGSGAVYEKAEGIQNALSFLPDYAFKGSESAAGTTVSGLVGALIVGIICFMIATALRGRRRA